jgi:glutaryl-CoA dehydrogenase
MTTDYYLLDDLLTDDARAVRERVRAFVESDLLPVINDYWDRAEFPWPLVPKLAALGVVGGAIEGYGCPGLSPLAAGMVTLEMSRGDGSINTFLGVQSGLAMGSINLLGSDEQKQRWLPAMATLDKIGAFALTEPNHGSDSVALETTVRRDGDTLVLNGAKRWIGNASIANVVVVWARDTEDGRVKAVVVEKNPTFGDIPVIFISARKSIEDERAGMEAGALEYFTKPLDMDRLIARLREILEERGHLQMIAPA